MKIQVIAFGKLKSPGLRDAAEHFKKMIQPWISFEETELKALVVPEKSPALRAKIQEKEAEILLENLGPKAKFYILDEKGKSFSSQHWAEMLQINQDQGVGDLAFCIGSSLGFSDAIRQKAKGTLSLGPQTFSHELARVVLFEQLYRAMSILKRHPYHNEG
ncbi:23S rRNA (pseudouridine(1915)-N(3))-methyltransferase RlmH [bacterium]|nr:23S rRNA (pseudouridine(1915)-N(3))-methyltransferase RlmH [bacterium]